ncbi:GGDEF-domain containing protein [Pseudomonas fluvialis]|uniref:cyclic-guanylate-specific phosphodiesterase n=1 Tax=Pseudomonas fluvialis TaxID=1793966 RepID=A0A2I0CT31_9PSED|nr:EAL domain-containing protein [Pseudomonas pharmacofabricae]PKF72484.1 GGDEF-domain containing protein [Pseudomonas pharmacofabricae]
MYQSHDNSPLFSRSTLVILGWLAAVLLIVWLLPANSLLKTAGNWFPTWLHSCMELLAIVVAALVFSISWHSYRSEQAGNLSLLACGYLAVALLDSAHLLSYRGMPDFITPSSVEKAIDFWLAARLSEALVLLGVALRAWRPLSNPQQRYQWLAATLGGVALMVYLRLYQPQLFPRMFIEGQGLTPLKIVMEWLVIGLLACAAVGLLRRREQPFDRQGLLLAVGISILSELCFTAYRNPHDIYQLLGHAYKVLACLVVYRVVFVSSIQQPYIQLTSEISERRRAEQQVETLSFYDNLTGLPNLELLRDRTSKALSTLSRDAQQVALLYMDIDGFKDVNDSLGHACGDTLIRELGSRLQGLLRSSDTLCRATGDEFVILMPDVENAESVGLLAERILNGLQRPFLLHGHLQTISLSLGAAVAPHDGQDCETLLRNAETAMYQAKQDGRQTWRFFDSTMNQQALARLQLLNDLRQAIAQHQLQLYYQPQIDLASGRLSGVEALVRWQHPVRGMISPAEFIPAAEESRLIIPLGEWVLRQACAQAASWQRQGLALPQVAVNISAIQLQHGHLEESVLQALADSHLPASLLELEITESSLVDKTEQVIDSLKRLKAMGVNLSIDDFGTGYSSLAYLQTLAVDKLKIDQSFVRDLTLNQDNRAIVSAIVQMAHTLGLACIAEGVESQDIAAALHRLGCQQAQGYLYARPLPADELQTLLQDWPAAHWAQDGATE